jgi:hypothetical protein
MATWEDGPEYAPIERPDEFSTPDAAPLGATEPYVQPSANAPIQRPAFGDPQALTKIPDPQKEDSFAKSKLIWGELERKEMSGVLDLYKACLSLRSAERAFRPDCRQSFAVAVIGPGVGAIRLTTDVTDWLILFDLHGGHEVSLATHSICAAPSGSEWKLMFSTNDARFGGERTSALDIFAKQAHFLEPELVLLRADRVLADLAKQ